MSASALQDIQTRMRRIADVAAAKREVAQTLTENRRALWVINLLPRKEIQFAAAEVAASLLAIEQLYATKSQAADVETPRTLADSRALIMRAIDLARACKDDEMRAAIAAVRKTLVATVAGNPI